MKILGISGSHRKGQNSFRLLEEAMKGIREVEPAAETKIIELADLKLSLVLRFVVMLALVERSLSNAT